MPKSKAEKKKQRERESRNKVLRRRKAIRAAAKKEREDAMKDREYQKIANRAEGRTVINRSPEEQHELLQHNLEILQALKEQQDYLEAENAALAQRSSDVQKELMFGGHTGGFGPSPADFPQKPLAPRKGFKASADVVFVPNTVDAEASS